MEIIANMLNNNVKEKYGMGSYNSATKSVGLNKSECNSILSRIWDSIGIIPSETFNRWDKAIARNNKKLEAEIEEMVAS